MYHKIFQNKALIKASIATILSVSASTTYASLILSHGDTVTGDRGSNLIQNGSFENRGAAPAGNVNLTGVSGSRLADNETPINYTIPGWTASGDANSYGVWGPLGFGGGPAEGTNAVYLGNWFTTPSSAPTFNADGTVSFAAAPTFTNVFSGIQNPLTLSQTVNGLTVGQKYTLDFYTTGEFFLPSGYTNPGVFGLQITGESLLYLTAPAPNSLLGPSERYSVEFTASSPSMDFKWINWGHISQGSTELVLDDVILNAKVPEPATLAVFALGLSLIGFARRK